MKNSDRKNTLITDLAAVIADREQIGISTFIVSELTDNDREIYANLNDEESALLADLAHEWTVKDAHLTSLILADN